MAVFAIVVVTWILSSSSKVDDTIVKLKPMEEEIRQFLFVHNPTVLHKVDALMIKYRGREEELFERLKEKYSQNEQVEEDHEGEVQENFATSKYSSTLNEGDTKGRARIQQQIYDLIQEFDPKLLSSLPRMFADYRGREDELLSLCESEYLTKQDQEQYNEVHSPVMESTAPKSSGRYGLQHDDAPYSPSYTGMTENKYNMVPNYQQSAAQLRHTPQTKGKEYSPYAYNGQQFQQPPGSAQRGQQQSAERSNYYNSSSSTTSSSAQKASTPMQGNNNRYQQQQQPQSGRKQQLSAVEQAKLDARNSLQARMNQFGQH